LLSFYIASFQKKKSAHTPLLSIKRSLGFGAALYAAEIQKKKSEEENKQGRWGSLYICASHFS